MVCSGYVIVSTLHKGGGTDDKRMKTALYVRVCCSDRESKK